MRTTYVRSSYEYRTTLQSTIQSLNRFGVTRMQFPVRELLIIIKFINFLFIFNYPSKDFFISILSNFPGKFPTHLPAVRASDACRTCSVRRAYAFGNDFLQCRYNYVRTICVRCAYDYLTGRTPLVRMSCARPKTPPSCSGPPRCCATCWHLSAGGAGHPHVEQTK